MRGSAADLERALDKIARFQNSLRVNRADDDIDGVLLEALELAKFGNRNQSAIDVESFKTLSSRPTRDLGVKTFARLDQGREDTKRTTTGCGFHLPNDRSRTLRFYREVAIGTELRAGFG